MSSHLKNLYDKKYRAVISSGQKGWGGNDRISQLPAQYDYIRSFSALPTEGRVLELGCGEGTLSRMFQAEGYEVEGIDISQEAIQWAEKQQVKGKAEILYKAADLTQHQLEEDRYNLIIDGNCLHCIQKPDRPKLLSNIHKSLKKNGVFFISSMCTTTGEQAFSQNEESLPYRYFATEDELKAELTDAGFQIKQVKYSQRDFHGHLKVFCTK